MQAKTKEMFGAYLPALVKDICMIYLGMQFATEVISHT